MVRIIEYINKKNYVHHTKTGKQWRVPAEQKKEKNEKMVEKSEGEWTGQRKKRRFRPNAVAL